MIQELVPSKAIQVKLSAKFVLGNRFHVTKLILSPEICKQCLWVKR